MVASVGVLLGGVLPTKLIAEAALAFCSAAALHALLFRLYAWLYRTSWRKLLVGHVSDQTVYRLGVMAMASSLAVGMIHEPLRMVAVEAAFLLGVWLTVHPRESTRGLLEEIRERL